MYILGVNISHDASACLLYNGDIIFVQNQERLSKIKDRDVHEFTFFYGLSEIKKYTNYLDYIIFASYKEIGDKQIIDTISQQIKMEGISFGSIIFNPEDHHLYHAASGSFSSGFEECACLILDGAGSYLDDDDNDDPFREIESIYSFSYSKGLTEKFKHYSKNGGGFYNDYKIENTEQCQIVYSDSISCGILFVNFSSHLGYNAGYDAGKIMALSSYGKDTDNYGDWFFSIDDVERTNTNLIWSMLLKIKNSPFQQQADILQKLQKETKNHTINLIKKSLKLCNTKNIVLSGGYFLNCVNNYKYLKEFPGVNFYIDPIAQDATNALGAAKYLWYHLTKDTTIKKLDSLYLG